MYFVTTKVLGGIVKKIILTINEDTHAILKKYSAYFSLPMYKLVPKILDKWAVNRNRKTTQQQDEAFISTLEGAMDDSLKIEYIEDLDESKKCKKCGERKKLDQFYVHKHCYLGRESLCKLCYCARQREAMASHKSNSSEFRKQHNHRTSEFIKRKYRENPEWREKVKAYQRAHYHKKKQEKLNEYI